MLEFSDKEREEMGTRGREWMKEEFSWEVGGGHAEVCDRIGCDDRGAVDV